MASKFGKSWRVVALAVGAVAALLVTSGVALADPSPAPPPADYDGNLPDPSIVLYQGRYYAYGTQDEGGQYSNIQRVSSRYLHTWPAKDLTIQGEYAREALPWLLHPGSWGQPRPRWAVPGATWAPEVVHLGGRWLMYYTVHHPCDRSHPCSNGATDTQCISIATSSTPGGTFVDDSLKPFICQYSAGGSIDPAAFVDSDRAVYLYWKSTDSGSAAIYGQRLTSDGRSFEGPPVVLLRSSAGWESGSIEGPAMVQNNKGTYDLFYSGNRYDSRSYAIGYAQCDGPLSGCVKKTTNAPWFSTPSPSPGATDTTPYYSRGPNGPGGQSFLTGEDGRVIRDGDGTVTMAYAAWGNVIGPAPRNLWITPVKFDSAGQPVPPNGCWPARSC